MITQELLNNNIDITSLGKEINTTTFILSLFDADDLDVSDALSYLKKYIDVKKPIEELALHFVAYNFQLYKEKSDTILFDLDFNNVYGALAEQPILGFYSILKDFMLPYTSDWALKQIRTYNPVNNSCDERDSWVSAGEHISLEWGTAARMLATIICNEFDLCIASINNRLYKKLKKKDLALFFDLEKVETSSGYDDYRDLKNTLI